MSSGDEENESEHSLWAKKRKITRACDKCRSKKTKCDGSQMPNNQCSNCLMIQHECTYLELAPKRGPPKGYIHGLESRVERLEKLLRRLCPDGDYNQELDPTIHMPQKNSPSTAPAIFVAVTETISQTNESDAYETEDEDDLAESLLRLKIDPHNRFFGKSSDIMLIQTAIDIKNEYLDNVPKYEPQDTPKPPSEYWKCPSWQVPDTGERKEPYEFPPPDLMESLVELYFSTTNTYLPLLHRPTFTKALLDELHFTDDLFATTALLVCAIGSKYSKDQRTYLDHETSPHCRGWKYFLQVDIVANNILTPPTLFHLQYHVLAVVFLEGSSAPHAAWAMVGISLRLAQDVGAQRKKQTSGKVTLEDELWKRAFWVAICLDRLSSSSLGVSDLQTFCFFFIYFRTETVCSANFDIDYPLICDDNELEEYMTHPVLQDCPPSQPSYISCFNCLIELLEIQAFTLRTIYSINKSKILLGFYGHDHWEPRVVKELDSALNHWIAKLPPHLVWDDNRELGVFFSQSTFLYTLYYHLQILVHRPFIAPSGQQPSSVSFRTCTNAAKMCARVVRIYRERTQSVLPYMMTPVFTAGIVQLLYIWGNNRVHFSAEEMEKEMTDVYACMGTLKMCEGLWYSAGRLCDILCELAYVGDIPFPLRTPPPPSGKRDRDSSSNAIPSNESPSPDRARQFAGTRRVATQNTNHIKATQQIPQRTAHRHRWPVDKSYISLPPSPPNPDTVQYAQADQYRHQGHHENFQVYNSHRNYDQSAPYLSEYAHPQEHANESMLIVWQQTPGSFGMDEWGAYLSNEVSHR